MVKQKVNPVNPPSGERHGSGGRGPQEPLSGSKKVKNKNHTQGAPHEGS